MNELPLAVVGWTIAALVLFVPVLVVQRARVTPFLLTMVLLIPLVTGHALLDAAQPGDQVTWLYYVGLVALVSGYCIASRHATRSPLDNSLNLRSPLIIALAVIGALSVYHFAVAGIPIFSTNVEIARFDFTSSGLLGLPGRAYLYGLPIIATLAIFYATRHPTWHSRALMITSVALLLLSDLASGFKGALLEFGIVVLFAATTSSTGVTIRRAAITYLTLAAAAGAYAIGVMPAYVSYSGLTSQQMLNTLIDRMTASGALPGHMVMQNSPPLIELPANITALDFSYMMYRYLGIDLGQHFNFDQIVAASINHSALSNSSAPVTVGAFPQLVYDYGALVAVIGVLVLGFAYRQIESIAQSTRNPNVYTVSVGALLALNAYLTKGGLVYLAVNWTAMLVFTLLLLNIPRLFANRATPVTLDRPYRDEPVETSYRSPAPTGPGKRDKNQAWRRNDEPRTSRAWPPNQARP